LDLSSRVNPILRTIAASGPSTIGQRNNTSVEYYNTSKVATSRESAGLSASEAIEHNLPPRNHYDRGYHVLKCEEIIRQSYVDGQGTSRSEVIPELN
jgi:hypothetical protein